MTQPTILNMQMTPAGVELTIAALRKLPHEQVNDLVQELWQQYKAQMQALAEATLAPEAAETDTDGGSAD